MWWQKPLVLKNTSELFSSDVAAFGSIEVLELWFDQNSLVLNLCSNSCKQPSQSFLFSQGKFSC